MLSTVLLLTSLAFAQDPPATPPVTPAPVVTVAPATPEVVVPATPATPVVAAPDATTPPAAPPEVKVPSTEAEAVAQGTEAFSLLQAGSWGAGIVLVLGVLIFVYNKFIAKKKAA